MSDDDLLELREVAKAAGIPYETARYRLRTRGLKPVKFHGNTGLYEPSVVEKVREKKWEKRKA